MRSYIFITTSFVGLHYWPAAKAPVTYLAHPHRHVFKIRVEIPVTHDDREIEFIQVKERLDDYLTPWKTAGVPSHTHDLGACSCETLARDIADVLNSWYPDRRVASVEVSEDGENGAILRLE